MLWNIYVAFFQSQLRYGIILWGEIRESIKVLCIPKMVIRLITGIKKYEPVDRKSKKTEFLQ